MLGDCGTLWVAVERKGSAKEGEICDEALRSGWSSGCT